MTKHQNNIFSIMKGIAIIAVVIGHCSINYVEGFVNQFHLATFYFLAGYFFKTEYVSEPWIFIKKRINRLYIPFILYGTSFLLLHNIFCKLGLYSAYIYTWKEIIQKELYMIIRFSSNEPFMGAMWFLGSLFVVSVIFLLLFKIASYSKKANNIIRALGTIVLYISGYYALKHNIPNVYGIFNAFILIAILYCGYLFRQYKIFEKFINNKIALACTATALILYISGITIRLQPQFIVNNNSLLFLLISINGVIMVYGISKLLYKTIFGKIIAICGDLSFEIMALHFICFKLITILHIYIEGADFEHLRDFPVYSKNLILWSPLYVIAGVFIPILLTFAVKIIKSHIYKC